MRLRREVPLTALLLPLAALLPAGCTGDPGLPVAEAQDAASYAVGSGSAIPVSGAAIHFFSTAVIHSEEPVPDGMVQRSTDIIRLTGDLDGYILYHPMTTFDFAAGTLVNTGRQVFSGTIAGSAPVVLHDDRFRFTVDLATGATTGAVHLTRSRDAPASGGWFDCDLVIVGTGLTAAGDGLADYSGTCTPRGARQ